MKLLTKIGAVLLVSILLISSIYVVSFMESEESDNGGNNGGGNDSNGNNNNNSNNGNDNNDNFEAVHTVFIEEATATSCQYCPNVGNILENLEASKEYRFYYVSLVDDKNSKAADRLNNDYNKYADPTVFIDGGYKVILGGKNPESQYAQAIREAENRPAPSIRVTVTAEYKNSTDEVLTKVLVENKEDKTYSGRLRVYLVDIISPQWNDYNGKKYQNTFLDFILNEDISIPAKENDTFSKSWDVSNLDYENLKIIAVVFNSEAKLGYANPPNQNRFDAYYADAANATDVAEQKNPSPEVGITSHQNGKIYLNDKLFLKFLYKNKLLKNTILIGKATIKAYAKDDSKIEKVEFYLDNDLVATLTSEPYEWKWTKTTIGRHTLKVIAYDDTGKTSTDSMDVIAFINLIGLLSS
jgi:glutaredoxin